MIKLLKKPVIDKTFVDWNVNRDNTITLIFADNSVVTIKREDFEKDFGVIADLEREDIIKRYGNIENK